MRISELRQFPAPVWIVLLGTLIARATFFMVWPFMAVILHRKFAMPQAQIGAIMSIAAMASAVFALYIGYISDRLGRKSVIVLACLVYFLAFVLLALADTAWLFAAGAVMVGVGRSSLEPPARAMISDLIEETNLRQLAHHMRYYMINVGAALGPLLGLKLGFSGEQSSFWFVGVTYLFWGLAFVLVFYRVTVAEPPKSPHNFRETLKVLKQDHAFLLLVIANALVMYCYMHQETSLVQHLNQLGEQVVSIYTTLILINASIIIVFQFPLLKLLSSFSLYARVYIGVAGLLLAFLIYSFTPLHAPLFYWYLGTAVFSIGEVILFPTFNLLIDHMSPDNMRGTYFGAGNLTAIGVSLSPLIGGFLLQYFGGSVLFFSTVGVLVLAGWLYHRSHMEFKARRAALGAVAAEAAQ
jgi:MFS family permease